MEKKKLIISLILSFLLLACACPVLPLLTPTQSPTATPTLRSIVPPGTLTVESPTSISPDEAPFTYAWDDREPFRLNLTTAGQAALEGSPGASVYHLGLSFSNPPTHALGLEEVRYTNTEAIPLEEIDLALFPELLGGNIDIQSVSLDGAPVSPIYEEWLMRLPLPEPLQPREAVIIHIEFEVDIPSGGGDYYYGIFGYNSGMLSFAHAYPTILVYNEEGWNNQTPDLDGDPLFADSSFYLVSIDAPADLVLVTAGVELERVETADRQRVLIADGPARDFYLAASSEWIKQSASAGEITINSYAPADLESESQDALRNGVAAIETFSERYGAYPYSEFDIAPIVTEAGGVEYPGMTSISDSAYYWGDFLEIVVVHESAHMWFYNLVGNDTLDQPWLDESLAQFATWQYYLDRYGTVAAEGYQQADLQGTWDMAENPDTPIGLPVSAYPGYEYASIVYGRGAFFFLALRDRMGVEAFDEFMRAYVQQYAWGISSTEGFKALAEGYCNCNLTSLFDEWVYP
jgi:hypothetical protein